MSLRTLAAHPSPCDKCGGPVEYENDAVILAVLSGEIRLGELGLVAIRSRHLLPIEGCDGSPSRAQYIEGQARDARGYAYDTSLEPRVRKAYAEMQKEKA